MRWYPEDVEIGRRLISVVAPGNAPSLAVTRTLGTAQGWTGEREGRGHVVQVRDL